jgi:hypothetical protein
MSARQGICQENPPATSAATKCTSSDSLMPHNVEVRSHDAIESYCLLGVRMSELSRCPASPKKVRDLMEE